MKTLCCIATVMLTVYCTLHTSADLMISIETQAPISIVSILAEKAPLWVGEKKQWQSGAIKVKERRNEKIEKTEE